MGEGKLDKGNIHKEVFKTNEIIPIRPQIQGKLGGDRGQTTSRGPCASRRKSGVEGGVSGGDEGGGEKGWW